MSMKESYEKKLQAQLNEWKADIDKLRAQADKAEADAKIKYNKEITELQAMQAAAKQKLAELKETGDDSWEELKAGIENAWDSLSKAVKSTTAKFK